jgi:uncharacterized protein YqjF (DUF2071 family)
MTRSGAQPNGWQETLPRIPGMSSGYAALMGLLDEAVAQSSALREIAHRPWPLRSASWVIGQTWRNLLFAHWRVPAEKLRPHVPASLELEEFDGSAWLGMTPFLLTGLRLRGLPPVPVASSFAELNCRTYVRRGDRPGIWFFSLDASSRLFVEAARITYRLPYHHAHIDTGGAFTSRRGTTFFSAEYTADGVELEPERGTLEHFLTERYCLYADHGRARGDIHHRPWRLRRARAEVEHRNLAPVPLDGAPLCHFAERQDVAVWALEQL